METPTVECVGVSVRYARSSVPQVNDVSFRLERGITAVVGRNGAGKSTLVNALVGLLPVSDGSVRVLGHDPRARRTRPDVMRRIGYLPQEFGFNSNFTVENFVGYGAWLKGIAKSQRGRVVGEALDVVNLADRRRARMGKLSGGMRRRAGIAQSVVHRPELLILDEPTSGLDPEQRVRFRSLVRELARDRTVLLSSHLVEDVRVLADRIIVMESGRIGFAGDRKSVV